MKKAFTLVELLAVIVLLAIIGLIVYPMLNNVISNNKQKLYDKQISELERLANTWASSNADKLNVADGNAITLTFEEMYNSGLLQESKVKNPKTDEVLPGCMVLTWSDSENRFNIVYSETCNPYPDLKEYFAKDNSNANNPDLLDKMVPIVYTGSKWIVTDGSQEKWYSYDEKAWANAVILNDGINKVAGQEVTEEEIALWYVWIPRYKYQLFNVLGEASNEQVINIAFENNTDTTGTVTCTDAINQTDSDGNIISEICTNASNGNWYTHPGFTFGNQELTGFWMGKFRLSTTDEACNLTPMNNCNKILKPVIKPNVAAWMEASLSNYHESVQLINKFYSINNADNHITKNMEWGAVIYLKQSKYGLGITQMGYNNHKPSDNYGPHFTGCGVASGIALSTECNSYNTNDGMSASTTGNIYGVYDMNSYRQEYVMAHMANSEGGFHILNSDYYLEHYGFNKAIDSKYYDNYSYNTTFRNIHHGKLGDATKEVVKSFYENNLAKNSWYENSAIHVLGGDNVAGWLVRNGIGFLNSVNASQFRFARPVMIRN